MTTTVTEIPDKEVLLPLDSAIHVIKKLLHLKEARGRVDEDDVKAVIEEHVEEPHRDEVRRILEEDEVLTHLHRHH